MFLKTGALCLFKDERLRVFNTAFIVSRIDSKGNLVQRAALHLTQGVKQQSLVYE